MDRIQLVDVKQVLARYGISSARRAVALDPTEETILLSGADFRAADVDKLTLDLMNVIPHTKVWVVEDGPRWEAEAI
jgi:hypothetical protein